MPEAYDLHEARLIQVNDVGSAADALFVDVGPVPVGKIWTLIAAYYVPSAVETRYVWFAVVGRNGIAYPCSPLQSIPLSNVIPLGFLSEGNELKMYPGEKLRINRAVATAGSTMTMGIKFIESDLPYYAYDEPLNKVVKTKKQHGSIFRRSGGISIGNYPSSTRGGDEGGARGGGAEPI